MPNKGKGFYWSVHYSYNNHIYHAYIVLLGRFREMLVLKRDLVLEINVSFIFS